MERLTRLAALNSYEQSSVYSSYLRAQIAKSTSVVAGRPQMPERTRNLVDILDAHLPVQRQGKRALCVGCRDTKELDYLESRCGVLAEGVDLFSVDPRIKVGDMHRLPFADDSFDIVYACHSLEHAYDPSAALRELIRVSRHAGLLAIEVPTRFEATEVDRWDVESAEQLISHLKPWVGEEKLVQNSEVQRVGIVKHIARVVVTVSKGHAATARDHYSDYGEDRKPI